MKNDVIDAAVVSIQSNQVQALKDGLSSVFDAGVAEAVPSGGFSQADIDAAVAVALGAAKVASDQALVDQKAASDAALAEDEAADEVALNEAHAKADADLAAVNVALADMTVKEQLQENVVADLKKSIDSVQASFDAIKAILFPAA